MLLGWLLLESRVCKAAFLRGEPDEAIAVEAASVVGAEGTATGAPLTLELVGLVSHGLGLSLAIDCKAASILGGGFLAA
tara:strand:+ start:453 stop:689 length:237 start_codon:yes stop_codon:yes gene_type:complete